MPAGWTPDQIKQFQDYWDTEFAGDLARRRRAKFVPGDTAVKIQQTKEPEQKNDFDEWLARIICYAFSVPPQWAVKAMNRATADNQSAQAEDEGLEPTKEWVKDLIDQIIAEEFASPDLELVWLAEGDDDLGKNETALENRVKLGALTLNELRDALGLDPYTTPAANRPMVLTATGYVPIEAAASSSPAGLTRGSMLPRHSNVALEKYSPDQPRVPAGNSDGGQWTSGSAGRASGDSSDGQETNSGMTPNGAAEPVRYAALDSGTRTDAITPMPDTGGSPSRGDVPGNQYAAITVEQYDRTGDERVDKTSDMLFRTMVRDEDLVDRALVFFGKIGPALYGTLVHLSFGADVKWQDMPGIGSNGVEQSFSLGDVVHYGTNGSIRTDVVLRDDSGDIIAVWDLKTGNAQLTDARVREIRAELKISNDVPVLMLHIGGGIIRKRKALFRLSQ